MTQDTTDEQLVAACVGGNPAAFSQLYDRYIKKIYAFVFFKTHHTQTAEDLTSEVFMKALRALNSFKSNAGTFQSWLYQIARNRVIDHYRSDRSRDTIEDAWDIADDGDLAADIDTKHKLEKVREIINSLDSAKRDILILRLWQDLPYQQIAEITGTTEASCKMTVSRVLKSIRKSDLMTAWLLLLLVNV